MPSADVRVLETDKADGKFGRCSTFHVYVLHPGLMFLYVLTINNNKVKLIEMKSLGFVA